MVFLMEKYLLKQVLLSLPYILRRMYEAIKRLLHFLIVQTLLLLQVIPHGFSQTVLMSGHLVQHQILISISQPIHHIFCLGNGHLERVFLSEQIDSYVVHHELIHESIIVIHLLLE